jgi:predicted RNase H-like HicB family nuclease
MKLKLTEEICKEGNMFVSYCPELDIPSCGEDVQQAKTNLYEAILITIEETRKMGTFQDFLEECGIELSDKSCKSCLPSEMRSLFHRGQVK